MRPDIARGLNHAWKFRLAGFWPIITVSAVVWLLVRTTPAAYTNEDICCASQRSHA